MSVFAQVPMPHNLCLGSRKVRHLCKLTCRGCFKTIIQGRNQQHLKAYLWPHPVACRKSDCGGEIRARTGATHSNKVSIEIQISALVPKKFKGPVTVCKGSGEWFLGSKSVCNTYDSTLCIESVMNTLQLFRKKITAKKTTPMKVK